MPEDTNSPLPFPRLLAAVLLAGLLIASFLDDWRLVTTGGSIDFRNRITGARVLVAGLDPFHYKWQSGAPAEFLDPYNSLASRVSPTTVTPAMLALMLPLAAQNYAAAQAVWLWIEWLCLLGTGLVWWRLLAPGWKRWLWAGLVVAFSHTLAWKLHIDRGQIYILLAFLVSLWILLVRERRPVWAGIVAGFLLCLRPPLLLVLAPFIGFRDRGQWRAAAITSCVLILLPMAFKAGIWADYGRGMQGWSALHRHGDKPRPPAQSYPATVEGMDLDQLARFHVRQYADSSIVRILRGQGMIDFPGWPLALALVLGVGAWFWTRRQAEEIEVLAGIAAWAFLMDWFLPAYRAPYNDVLVLAALAIALQRDRRFFWVALTGLPTGWLMYHILPPARWHIHIPTIFLLVAGLGMLFPARSRIP